MFNPSHVNILQNLSKSQQAPHVLISQYEMLLIPNATYDWAKSELEIVIMIFIIITIYKIFL